MRLDLDGLANAAREALMMEWREVVGRSPPKHERSNKRIITVVFGGKSTTTMIAQISKLTDLGFRKTPSR